MNADDSDYPGFPRPQKRGKPDERERSIGPWVVLGLVAAGLAVIALAAGSSDSDPPPDLPPVHAKEAEEKKKDDENPRAEKKPRANGIEPQPISRSPEIAGRPKVKRGGQPSIPSNPLRWTAQWTAPMGPGGATVRRFADDAKNLLMTRLLGLTVPPGSHEVLFIGVHEPNQTPLSSPDLLDSFVLSSRAFLSGGSPGVSIDPRAEHLGRPFQAGDTQVVRYEGGIGGSRLGLDLFESDRIMKCLSLGRDNLTDKPFGSKVPGFKSRLEMLASTGGESESAWHRFWFEPADCQVRHSLDGRTVLADSRMIVQTERMTPQNGQLVASGQPPEATAARFAEHLSKNFDAYRDEFAVFTRMHVAGQIACLAEAMRPPTRREDDVNRPRPTLDWFWLTNLHTVARVATPSSTPALVAKRSEKNAGAIRTLSLLGGVTLRPRNSYQPDPIVETLQRAILSERERRPNATTFEVPVGARRYVVAAVRIGSTPDVAAWQVDLEIPGASVIRDYSPQVKEPAQRWNLRRPQLIEAKTRVTLQPKGLTRPSAVFVGDHTGDMVVLDQLVRHAWLDNGVVEGYVSRDHNHRLYCFANVWIYASHTQLFSDGANKFVKFQSNGRVVYFSPEESHVVREMTTSGGKTVYEHESGRLARVTAGAGPSIDFAYDERGRCIGLKVAGEWKVAYRYSPDGELRTVVNDVGHAIFYRTGRSRNELRMSGAGSLAVSAQQGNHAGFAYGIRPMAPVPATLPDLPARFVHLDVLPARDRLDFELRRGDGETLPLTWEQLLILPEAFQNKTISVRQQRLVDYLREAVGRDGPIIVVSEDAEALAKLESAVRVLLPERSLCVARDSTLALRNLRARPARGGPAQVLVAPGLSDAAAADAMNRSQKATANLHDSETVIIVGHNEAPFARWLHDLGENRWVEHRNVILLTCGSQDTPTEVESLLRAHGAVNVVYFPQPIANQYLLPALVDAVQQRLKNAVSISHTDTSRLLREAIEDLLREVQAGRHPHHWLEQLQRLRRTTEQIGRTRPRHGAGPCAHAA